MATKAIPVVSPFTLPKVVWVFLVGGLGGIAPTMLRFGVDLSQKRMTVHDVDLSILAGVTIFFLLGGAVSAIWDEVDLKKVFYIGLGLPSLITVATSAASAPQPQKAAEALSDTKAVVAVANVRFLTVSQNGRLEIVLPPEVGYDGATATFYGSGNPFSVPINGRSALDVPNKANEVMIMTPKAQSERIPLRSVSTNSLLVLSLAAEKDPLYGLKYAVGVHSKPFRLTVVSQTITGRVEIPGGRPNVV